jgi:hypothetical protein
LKGESEEHCKIRNSYEMSQISKYDSQDRGYKMSEGEEGTPIILNKSNVNI